LKKRLTELLKMKQRMLKLLTS